jgi:hypothetical protein
MECYRAGIGAEEIVQVPTINFDWIREAFSELIASSEGTLDCRTPKEILK